MTNRPTKLFGTAGIRGLYGKKVTHKLVSHVSRAISELYPNEGIVVGHDARTSSETLSQTAVSIFIAQGLNVYYAGLCSFPVIANLTLNEKHSVALYITASHNPPEYNGIKILRNGREFTENEQHEIEKIVFKNLEQPEKFIDSYVSWDQIKPLSANVFATEQYLKRLEQTIGLKGDGRTIIIDCANGPMSVFVPKYISKKGFRVISINAHVDGAFPGRLAEPTAKNLSLLIALCKKEHAIGVAFDGDGDRIAFVDENGNMLELSRVNALFADFILQKNTNGKIVVSIDSSTCIDKHASKYGVDVLRTKLGELHTTIRELYDKGEKVIFAAEPWKPIFTDWGWWIDGMFGLVTMLHALTTTNTTLQEMIKKVPFHYSERKAYYVDESKADEIYQQWLKIMENFFVSKNSTKLTIDGVRYDLPDGTWMLIRKSGTEPKIRVYYESPDVNVFGELQKIVKKMEEIINK